jgi:hypothetical protein
MLDWLAKCPGGAYDSAMAFPTKLLNEGEEIALDARPHWWFMAEPTATLVASVLLGIIVLVWNSHGFLHTFVRYLTLILVIGSLAWFGTRYAKWATTNFVVTSHRLIFRHGVIAKSGIEIPLDKVMNVIFDQTIFERMLGAGSLLIESGGEDGQQRFTDIRRPAVVQNEIYRQMQAHEASKYDRISRNVAGTAAAAQSAVPPAPVASGNTPTQVAPTPGLSIPDQLKQLDELRTQGIITEEEFSAKKAELLERM